MNRRLLQKLALGVALMAGMVFPWAAHAQDEAPDAFVKRLSNELLDLVKNDKAIRSGDFQKVVALVDTRVLPNVDFKRMTASAVGPAWRQATPDQQARLQTEFKTLLVRTYAGALAQVSDQSIVMKPARYSPEDKDVLVRSEIRGHGDPIQLEYRLEKTPGDGAGWKIYNINVLGVWLVETYKSQFAQEINTSGIDGLIASLVERNKANQNGKKG